MYRLLFLLKTFQFKSVAMDILSRFVTEAYNLNFSFDSAGDAAHLSEKKRLAGNRTGPFLRSEDVLRDWSSERAPNIPFVPKDSTSEGAHRIGLL